MPSVMRIGPTKPSAVIAAALIGLAGMPCLWSRRAAKAAEPVAAVSARACVVGTVASKAAMVESERMTVAAAPATAAVPRTMAGVAKDELTGAALISENVRAVEPMVTVDVLVLRKNLPPFVVP